MSALRPDAIVLVDGGTDLLMRGDEAGLGTPEEDMTSLAAVAGLTGVPVRIAACIGFGIDAITACATRTSSMRSPTLGPRRRGALYFAFELEAVARRSLYFAELEHTDTIFQVSARIEAFRHTVAIRPRRAIPH